jgi:transposase
MRGNPLGKTCWRKRRRNSSGERPGILEDADTCLSGPLRTVLAQLQGELRHIQSQIEQIDEAIVKVAGEHEACRRLMTIPGVGSITATAVVAAIANGVEFSKGRAFATWLGLVPGQCSPSYLRAPTRMS